MVAIGRDERGAAAVAAVANACYIARVLGILLVGVLVAGLGALTLLVCVCVAIALCETLNQPDAAAVHLTAAGLVGAARCAAAEIAAIVGCVLLLPLGLRRRSTLTAVAAGTPLVVLVHGWAATGACFAVLERRLRAAGWPCLIAIDYRSVAGDVEAAARIVGDAVAAHRRATGATRVLLVAHGIGGLVCRVYLRDAGARAAVSKLVTLATAHQGSKLFALSVDPMLAALRDGSVLLADLAADRPAYPGLDVIAIAASFDPFVVPATRAHLPGASNIVVEGVGHFGTLWSARVFALVEENLRDEPTVAAEEA